LTAASTCCGLSRLAEAMPDTTWSYRDCSTRHRQLQALYTCPSCISLM
jgi:hypothetical protein